MKPRPVVTVVGILLVFLFLGLAAAGKIPGITPERSLLDQVHEKVVCPQFPPDELDILC